MRIALLIPAARAWRWHAVLIEELRREHQVDVFTTRCSPLPATIRLYLAFERLIFRTPTLSIPVNANDISNNVNDFSTISQQSHDLLIDLSPECSCIKAQTVLTLNVDGARNELGLIARLLLRQNPALSVMRSRAAQPVAYSYPAIEDRDVLSRALALIFARSIALLLRAVESISEDRCALGEIERGLSTAAASHSPISIARFAIEVLFRKATRFLTAPFSRVGHWRIAVRSFGRLSGEVIPELGGYKCLSLPANAFYADPFLYRAQNRTFLFAEKFDYSSKRGVIVCAPVSSEGIVGQFETVLETPYHLSYPFVFEHDDSIYMMPETRACRNLQLYRCVEFPARWKFEAILMENVTLSDATLLQYRNRWWIFAAADAFDGSTHDELVAFFAPTPKGPWRPHARNPLVSDCRHARPAGRFLVRGQKLLRPAQDCEKDYGFGLVWREVVRLSPDDFHELEMRRWTGVDFGDFQGVHSYSTSGEFEAVDLKCTMPRMSSFWRSAFLNRIRGVR